MTADDIVSLHKQLRDKIRDEWKRVLPFGEEISDRWEKARYLNFGDGSSIYDASIVIGDVRVGEKTWIGPFTILDGSGGLTIGSYCSISAGVQIYTHDSVKWALSGGKRGYEKSAVIIGECCYIGPNTIITRGTKIGDRCVIGANSFVNRDIPNNSIAFGVPARIVGQVIVKETGDIDLRYDNTKGIDYIK